ncbi:preprotein translocase subunit SecG [Salinisphaera hydrothermalis]|uniref:Protein-export membrane protein SecG n=1 Tax=Salinisphaera hydrothermalis (strain C41B8) TaxID=1304275 RepID=A0A084IJU6_SALHC|nr:preprotein translocase subunit SecG [Salinisphaera hydrothermalis]KEZ76980.1 preprotein translocase subunit SecG [Salinisphaera hydrothermalis C41B8]
MVYTILVIAQVVIALALIALILLQHGKGADAGAAFGSGASGTVFGAKGSANFMSRATAGLATLFMLTSLTLAYLVNGASVGAGGGSVTDQLTQRAGSGASVVQQQTENKGAGDQAKKVQGGQSSGSAGSASSDKSKNNGPKIPD